MTKRQPTTQLPRGGERPKPRSTPWGRGRAAGLGAALLLTSTLAPPVHAQPDDLDAWLAVTSRHFVLYTDATPARGAEILANLELFRAVFARLAPGLELNNPAPTKIVAFRDRETYAPYKPVPDGGGSVVLGYFFRHPDGNFLTLDAGTRIAGAFAVIFHEFVHYLVDHNFPGVPRWFNEGLAEYYSTFAVEVGPRGGDRGGEVSRVHLGRPVERHVRWLRYDNQDRRRRWMSHDFSLAELLEGDVGHHGADAGGYYALSWALVHYLLSGGPDRLDQAADFLFRIRDGEAPGDALEAAFDVRLGALEETLRAYAVGADFAGAAVDAADLGAAGPLSVARLPAPEALFHLGDLLARMGRPEAAERHFQAALDLSPSHPEAHAGLALVRDLEGRYAEADLLHRDAVRLGSRDPLTYLRFGRHLLAQLRPEENAGLVAAGKLMPAAELTVAAGLEEGAEPATLAAARDAFARAVDLAPAFAEARVLLGASHLFGDADPKPGIAALQKARGWLPERHDVSFYLVLLHLKKKDFATAERLVASDLEEVADDELVRQAREEIERARLLDRSAAALEEGDVGEALRLFDEAIAVTTDQDLRDRMAARLTELQERLGS